MRGVFCGFFNRSTRDSVSDGHKNTQFLDAGNRLQSIFSYTVPLATKASFFGNSDGSFSKRSVRSIPNMPTFTWDPLKRKGAWIERLGEAYRPEPSGDAMK